MGAKDIMKKVKNQIGTIKDDKGESLVSLEGVPCMGVCSGAPAMRVNKDRYLDVTMENIDGILNRYIHQ